MNHVYYLIDKLNATRAVPEMKLESPLSILTIGTRS